MKLERTRISFLVTLSVFTSAIGWSLARLWPHWFLVQLPVPALNAITMWFLALTLLVWTLMARKRLLGAKMTNRLHPLVAARTVALAMAGSRVGALVLGFYIGLLAVNFQLTRTPDVSNRLRVIALVAVAALLLCIIAVWLERLFQVKQPPTDGSDAASA